MDELRSKLFYEQKNGYDLIDTDERIAVEDYCGQYMSYLNDSRTEREAVKNAIALAEEQGFVEYELGMELKPGMRIYRNNRGKALMLAVIGKKSLAEGAVIAGAHVDSPRLDLKQITMYETDELCYFKTHYYGGIKKYQWVTIPLELHGVVALKSGETVEVTIGREPGEPRFVITDLLPHLAADQMKKTMAEGISGEGLNILIGSTPYADEGKDRVKLAVMSLLNDMYGITEEDFLSAELVAVPAYDVTEIGLDRSMIGAYGHDDRVCAYAELKAIFDVEDPEKTSVCILADKEEIGSDGVTGMQSMYVFHFMQLLCRAAGQDDILAFRNSVCLSADVTAAYDPSWAGAFEKQNGTYAGRGVAFFKYTGSRGKSAANDASAELVGYVTRMMDDDDVAWQIGELGRLDLGGGGTIAKYVANRGIPVIDIGVPVLSMHSPFEVIHKTDLYMAYRAFVLFNQAAE